MQWGNCIGSVGKLVGHSIIAHRRAAKGAGLQACSWRMQGRSRCPCGTRRPRACTSRSCCAQLCVRGWCVSKVFAAACGCCLRLSSRCMRQQCRPFSAQATQLAHDSAARCCGNHVALITAPREWGPPIPHCRGSTQCTRVQAASDPCILQTASHKVHARLGSMLHAASMWHV